MEVLMGPVHLNSCESGRWGIFYTSVYAPTHTSQSNVLKLVSTYFQLPAPLKAARVKERVPSSCTPFSNYYPGKIQGREDGKGTTEIADKLRDELPGKFKIHQLQTLGYSIFVSPKELRDYSPLTIMLSEVLSLLISWPELELPLYLTLFP